MPSVKSVAELAGVAVGTVSRVINNNPSVNPETRDRVWEAIKQLNYVPNEIARNFKMQKSMMVALLLPTVAHPFFAELAFQVEDELDKHNYKMILCNSKGKPQKELYYFNVLNQNKVAGIIANTFNNIDHHAVQNIPIVTFDRHITHEFANVSSDNYQGGRLALRELVKAGAKRVAIVAYQPQKFINIAISEVDKRRLGFQDEAAERNIPYIIYEIKDDDAQLTLNLDKVIASDGFTDVEGVFISGDALANRFIARARAFGLRIPKELKVIGYDGITNPYTYYPITSSIHQPIEEMARKMVQMLIQGINGEAIAEKAIVFPVEFIKGETT